mmetsp:Transcript_20672/g.36734  ORF Transcript_20672/g.36734 Transcript_20672/m.36734 type:complete len:330 (-) Transcript_20672:67-1056(-)
MGPDTNDGSDLDAGGGSHSPRASVDRLSNDQKKMLASNPAKPDVVYKVSSRRLRDLAADSSAGSATAAAERRRGRENFRVDVSPTVRVYGRVYDGGAHAAKTIVFVHQWSILGGSMGMMHGMAERLWDKGYNTIIFNLRGVGKSTGTPTLCGCTETGDVEAVCRYTAKRFSGSQIYIVASSAGAPIGGSVIDKVDEIEGYIAIGYLFGWATALFFCGHYPGVLCTRKRRLFINGSCDMFTSVCEFLCCWGLMCCAPDVHTIPGGGHFEIEGPEYDNHMVELIELFIEEQETPSGSYGCLWCLPTSCCTTCVFGTFAAIAVGIVAATVGL